MSVMFNGPEILVVLFNIFVGIFVKEPTGISEMSLIFIIGYLKMFVFRN